MGRKEKMRGVNYGRCSEDGLRTGRRKVNTIKKRHEEMR